jgi:hypothetical protein
MKLGKALGVFAANAVWRATGLQMAGRALVRALGSTDENVRTIAGIFLVRAGRKSEPLLQEALDKRENLPVVLTIIGSIGDRKLEPQVRQFINDRDTVVANAARDALRLLNAGQTIA